MYKFLFFIFLIVLSCLSSRAQTSRDKIEKAYKHPDRSKNSAKADVLIAGKKTIYDTIPLVKDSTVVVKNKARKKRKQ